MESADVERLFSGLAVLSKMLEEYDDTPMKTAVLHAMVSIAMDDHPWHNKADELEFLPPPIVTIRLASGLVAYTSADMQANFHFLIPRRADLASLLFAEMITHIEENPAFSALAINMHPLHHSLVLFDATGFSFERRRRALPPCSATSLTLVSGRVHWTDTLVDVVYFLEDPHDVVSFCPLWKASPYEKEDDTLYWARTVCGRLVVVRNPTLPLIPGRRVSGRRREHLVERFPPALLEFARSLNPPTVPHALRNLAQASMPLFAKTTLVHLYKRTFGIRDDLVLLVRRLLEDGAITRTVRHTEMELAAHLILRWRDRRRSSSSFLATSLCDFFDQVEDAIEWRQWMSKSRFVYALLDESDTSTVHFMCARNLGFASVLCGLLYSRMGRWKHHDRELARLLRDIVVAFTEVEGTPPSATFVSVLGELDRWEVVKELRVAEIFSEAKEEGAAKAAKAAAKEATSPENHSRHRSRGRRRGRAAARRAEGGEGEERGEREEGGGQREETHRGVADRLADEWPSFEWTLIGSGIFFRAHDVDLVVRVAWAKDLQAAYDAVELATGMARTGTVDGEHVVVLRGEREGFPIDVQVTAATETPSERASAAALSLSHRLGRELDAVTRENVQLLHRWADAAGLKGHRLCRLPGVAVTCLAVLFSRTRPAAGLGFQLDALRDLLLRDEPVDFDDLLREGEQPAPPRTPSRPPDRRPELPLSVVVHERNVASRLTAASTRHLLDAVAFSTSLRLDRAFDRAAHDAWRRETMVHCASVRARSDAAVAKTFCVALSKLSDHPIIDTLHAEEGAAGRFVLRCRIATDASSHYSFAHSGCSFAPGDGPFVEVARSSAPSRTWRLMASCGPAPLEDAALATRVADWIRVDSSRRIPNAPYLTMDALSCFDPADWEFVYGD